MAPGGHSLSGGIQGSLNSVSLFAEPDWLLWIVESKRPRNRQHKTRKLGFFFAQMIRLHSATGSVHVGFSSVKGTLLVFLSLRDTTQYIRLCIQWLVSAALSSPFSLSAVQICGSCELSLLCSQLSDRLTVQPPGCVFILSARPC